MENILLFLVTVTVYFTTIVCLDSYKSNKSIWNYSWKKSAKRLAFVALLALPLNINGNVFTIAGNATADKNMFSFFSLYQNAGQNAGTVLGLAYQNAGQDAGTFFGLAYQNARQDAVTVFGLAYQKAKMSAKVPLAIALYQRVGEKTRAFSAFSSLTKD